MGTGGYEHGHGSAQQSPPSHPAAGICTRAGSHASRLRLWGTNSCLPSRSTSRSSTSALAASFSGDSSTEPPPERYHPSGGSQTPHLISFESRAKCGGALLTSCCVLLDHGCLSSDGSSALTACHQKGRRLAKRLIHRSCPRYFGDTLVMLAACAPAPSPICACPLLLASQAACTLAACIPSCASRCGYPCVRGLQTSGACVVCVECSPPVHGVSLRSWQLRCV